MNVTALIDVVLVFMVVTPLLTKQSWIHTPKQEKQEVEKEQLTKEFRNRRWSCTSPVTAASP